MTNYWFWRSLTVTVGALLGSCATDARIGTTTLSYMSPHAVERYATYRATLSRHQSNTPSGTFVVNPNTGRTGYYVAWGWKDATSRSITKAMEYCGGGDSCKILDFDGRIVWKNISSDLNKKLLSAAKRTGQPEQLPSTEEYRSSIFSVESRQIQDYQEHLFFRATFAEPDTNAAFFVSKDGEHTGSAISKGNDSFHNSIIHAHRNCVVKSDQPCYLFATNGKPVNADAESAIE